MHGSDAENRRLLEAVLSAAESWGDVECAVCVPFPYLVQACGMLRGTSIAWGAQTVSEHAKGAYTGEVSAAMLKEFDCRYVIVGHSERRALFGERSDVVAQKFVAAQASGLTPILCIGETLAERDAARTEAVVSEQLDAVIERAGAASFSAAVVAYEPVWAIGTGKTATPQQAQEVHAHIRARIEARAAAVGRELRILYGGSVKAANAAELFAMPDIDGGLIGGASLVADDFVAICRAARG